MKIKIFGKLTDVFECAEYCIYIGAVCTVSILKSILEEQFSSLKGMTYIVVVNGMIADNEIEIFENSELALLPPYSGG